MATMTEDAVTIEAAVAFEGEEKIWLSFEANGISYTREFALREDLVTDERLFVVAARDELQRGLCGVGFHGDRDLLDARLPAGAEWPTTAAADAKFEQIVVAWLRFQIGPGNYLNSVLG